MENDGCIEREYELSLVGNGILWPRRRKDEDAEMIKIRYSWKTRILNSRRDDKDKILLGRLRYTGVIGISQLLIRRNSFSRPRPPALPGARHAKNQESSAFVDPKAKTARRLVVIFSPKSSDCMHRASSCRLDPRDISAWSPIQKLFQQHHRTDYRPPTVFSNPKSGPARPTLSQTCHQVAIAETRTIVATPTIMTNTIEGMRTRGTGMEMATAVVLATERKRPQPAREISAFARR